MTDCGSQRIETSRLVLRKGKPGDEKVLFETCFSLPEVTQYMRYPTHRSIEDTHAIFAQWRQRWDDIDTYHWVIALKDSDIAIGTIGVIGILKNDSRGELGYQLAKNHWGQGYMTEALSAVLAYMFEQAGINRIEAYHSENNPASGAVMRSCGMLYEGMAREKYHCVMGYQNCHMYAILKSDYKRR